MKITKIKRGVKKIIETIIHTLPSLIAQLIKNPLAMQWTPVQFQGWEDPLEKG